jgi:hypothetical protein
MNRSMQLAIAIILSIAAAQTGALARGFGGFHGGGFHAGGYGGFHAGGFGGYHYGGYGGYHAGGYVGYHAGGFDSDRYGGGDFGGYRADGFDFSAYRTGGYGGDLSRGELGSFLGLPTDGGMHAAAGTFAAAGRVYQGPAGTTIAHGVAGAQGIAAGPGGFAAGGRAASGTAIRTPNGSVYTHGTTAARGIAAGPSGVVAGRAVLTGHGYVGADGAHSFSPTYFHAQGLAASRWCAGRGVFTAGWVGAHPWAWHPGAYSAAAWATAAWRWATWPAVGTWLAWDAVPAYYDYGDNITYQDGYVYYGTQPLETEQTYYQQATNLASSGGDGNTGTDGQWLPLGVFGLMPVGEKTPQLVFQLAIDKAGTIRGNCYEPTSDTTLPVHGAVDKKDQRATWKIGSNQYMVVDTGLYNLTQDHSTALVHYSPDDTVEFVMVRIKQPSADQPASK